MEFTTSSVPATVLGFLLFFLSSISLAGSLGGCWSRSLLPKGRFTPGWVAALGGCLAQGYLCRCTSTSSHMGRPLRTELPLNFLHIIFVLFKIISLWNYDPIMPLRLPQTYFSYKLIKSITKRSERSSYILSVFGVVLILGADTPRPSSSLSYALSRQALIGRDWLGAHAAPSWSAAVGVAQTQRLSVIGQFVITTKRFRSLEETFII